MRQLSNVTNIPLSVAVFLATDTYDYIDDPKTISITSLLKPLRQSILAARVPVEDSVVDVASRVQSALGSAFHDGIERSWLNHRNQALEALGYPKHLIARIRINPSKEEVESEDIIPIYMEHRMFRELNGWTITGKCDFIAEGRVEDFKYTGVFTAINNTKDDDYIKQGSGYRWLAPDIITDDVMAINWIFSDWNKAKAMADKNYPQARLLQKKFNLLPLQEMERFISNKLKAIEHYWDAPEEDIPLCADDELWRSEPVFKYYKNPDKTVRSTKNYPTREEAMLRLIEDGSVGMVREVPGRVMACNYCPAFMACSQKDQLIATGELEIRGIN